MLIMFSTFVLKRIVSMYVIFLFPRNALSNQFSSTSTVTLYSETGLEGSTETLHINDCKSTFTEDKPPKSISSYSGCVNLYQEKNCIGNFIIVKPNTPGLKNLDSWNSPGWTRDKISSIGPCLSECSHKISANHTLPKTTSAMATLYTLPDFKGHHRYIKIQGCTMLPAKLRRKSSTIDIHSKVCVQLYESWNCSGRSIQIDKSAPRDFRSDLSAWNFRDKIITLSLCGYNCNDSVKPQVRLPTWPNAITFYSKAPFRGTIKNVNVTYDQCVNIKGHWGALGSKGSVESIETYGGCINLYEKEGCNQTIGNHLQLNESTPVLFWDYEIKSMSRCPKPESTSQNHAVIYVGISLFLIILLLSGLVIGLLVNRNSNEYVQVLHPQEIDEFHKGIDIPKSKDGGENLPVVQQSLPYDQRLEISKEYFIFDKASILGQGEFGVVYKGDVNLPNSCEQFSVAVKAVKPYCDVEYVRGMLKEIKTMIYVGNHPNIVPLIGCNTENLQSSELFIMTELCPNGSLEAFLNRNQSHFINLLTPDNALDKTQSDAYTDLKTLSEKHLNTFHLLQWSFQIGNGMMHLESKNVIHGDLAARNILLDQSYNAKISDFGLSRQLYANVQYYAKKSQTPLPWRNMAIESLKSLNFSIQSDVWSYGITLWEIFSLGDVPFPGRVWTQSFLDELTSGLRPPKPKFAPSDMYELMQSCWIETPSFRPSFAVLTQTLKPKLGACKNQSSDCLYTDCIEIEKEL